MILLFGATGEIGSNLTKMINKDELIVCGRKFKSSIENAATTVVIDLMDDKSIYLLAESIKEIDCLVYCASATATNTSVTMSSEKEIILLTQIHLLTIVSLFKAFKPKKWIFPIDNYSIEKNFLGIYPAIEKAKVRLIESFIAETGNNVSLVNLGLLSSKRHHLWFPGVKDKRDIKEATELIKYCIFNKVDKNVSYEVLC